MRAAGIAILAIAIAVGATVPARAADQSFARVERGRYLVDAGDCVACHTVDGDTPLAGGRAVETPFGTIYSPNLTPDRDTGIGAWSDEDFYRAMHFGQGPDGTRLYPAFPYPWFTRMTREDVMDVRAYLATLPPVRKARPENDLVWPLNNRVAMRGWNWLFFKPGTFVPDGSKSAEWNRGAYLVEGPGHCGACHTPTNPVGAAERSRDLTGNRLQHWFAPQLANDERVGLGGWSDDEIVEYLKTGRNARSGATGLMAEVVANSTSKLTKEDLHAIAVYIKDVAGRAPDEPDAADQAAMSAGKAIFDDSCAACHRSDGAGVPRMFPPLAHNANVQSVDPTSVIRVILQGAQTVPTDAAPTPSTMPAFDWKLNDDEIAAVASYVRNSWGNAAAPVSADRVAELRRGLRATTN
jgi:mono/diheme cytochrome c family protein